MQDDHDAAFDHLPVQSIRCYRQTAGPEHRTVRPEGSGDWLMIHTHQGEGLATTGTGAVRLLPGDLLLYPPGEPHDYCTSPQAETWVHTWVHFVPRTWWMPLLQWQSADSGLRIVKPAHGSEWPEVTQALARMNLSYWSHPMPCWKELAFNALEEVLLRVRSLQSGAPLGRLDPRIRRALDHLVTHLEEPFLLDDLAHAAGMSVSGLAHLFRTETGVSPRNYLERCRMELALNLLQLSQSSISEIAAKTGFSSPYYFTNRFRSWYGKTPSQVRKDPPATS